MEKDVEIIDSQNSASFAKEPECVSINIAPQNNSTIIMDNNCQKFTFLNHSGAHHSEEINTCKFNDQSLIYNSQHLRCQSSRSVNNFKDPKAKSSGRHCTTAQTEQKRDHKRESYSQRDHKQNDFSFAQNEEGISGASYLYDERSLDPIVKEELFNSNLRLFGKPLTPIKSIDHRNENSEFDLQDAVHKITYSETREKITEDEEEKMCKEAILVMKNNYEAFESSLKNDEPIHVGIGTEYSNSSIMNFTAKFDQISPTFNKYIGQQIHANNQNFNQINESSM